MLAKVQRVGRISEVVEQCLLGSEALRPVGALEERVAVEVVRDVDPATRIAVLEPRAADVGVLLDDDERDAGLLQTVSSDEPGHPRPDDDDVERTYGVDVVLQQRRRAQVGASQPQLLVQQLERLVRDGRAGEESELAAQRLVVEGFDAA